LSIPGRPNQVKPRQLFRLSSRSMGPTETRSLPSQSLRRACAECGRL
jgi:hypothetical protein